jgi:hypothetical protein
MNMRPGSLHEWTAGFRFRFRYRYLIAQPVGFANEWAGIGAKRRRYRSVVGAARAALFMLGYREPPAFHEKPERVSPVARLQKKGFGVKTAVFTSKPLFPVKVGGLGVKTAAFTPKSQPATHCVPT